MNCWHCDKPAHGVCHFCGRAVCKDHARTMPYIVTAYLDHKGVPDVLVTDNTLHCGICRPAAKTIEVPEMDPHEQA